MKHLLAISSLTIAAGIASATLFGAQRSEVERSPIYGVTVPVGYRNWEFVAPSHEAGTLDELRLIVANKRAMKAYRASTLPFPDGTVLVKLAWKHVPLTMPSDFSAPPQAYVSGHATTVQVMLKDSKRFATTGGWGYGRFVDGKAADVAQHQTCFSCHEANAKDHDYVFTRYAP
jgi:hypothetical protein